jgi:uncharacterized membrane protein
LGLQLGIFAQLANHTKDKKIYGRFFLLLGYCMPYGTGACCLLIDKNWRTNNH